MRRDLILATAEGYDWTDIEFFVESLTATRFQGEVRFFGSGMAQEDVQRLAERGFDVIRPRRLRLTLGTRAAGPRVYRALGRYASWVGYERERTTARLASLLASVEVARYFWYLDFLTRTGTQFENVMLTDVRDVVFLGPPFDFEIDDAAYFFLENERLRLDEQSYNREWLIEAYGPGILAELGERPIACSGVTIGSVRAVTDYLSVMVDHFLQLRREPRDQAVHNFVLHKGLVPGARLVANRDGPVLTVGTMSARDALAELHDRGEAIKVLHQYDRHPELADAVVELATGSTAPEGQLATRPVPERQTGRRRPSWSLLLPLAGVGSVALSAVLVEVFTDRDWRLSGFEWPEDFVTAALLVLLVHVAYSLVRSLTGGEVEPDRPAVAVDTQPLDRR